MFKESGAFQNKDRGDSVKDLKKERHPILSRLERLGKLGAVLGVTYYAGTTLLEGHKEDVRYSRYVEQTFTPEQRQRLDSLQNEVKNTFGESTVRAINSSDAQAFAERERQYSAPIIEGFEEVGLSNATVENFLSEETFFPRHWIVGEMGSIRFTARTKTTETPSGTIHAAAGFNAGPDIVTFFSREDAVLDARNVDVLPWHFKNLFAHEIAHANNWETDKDLDLLERVELLINIKNRMMSPSAYRSADSDQGVEEYYRMYESPRPADLYKMANEYWAEICKEYFTSPERLQREFPQDFGIVHRQVTQQDPSFDVFAVAGPFFDVQTGELLDQWQYLMRE